jgi:flagellar hook protein FlgE
LEVTEDGTVMANYTNGKSRALGKVVIADFPNAQGLRQIGNTMWRETVSSGQVLIGEAGGGRFGTVQAGALESANVDLTTQLVKLITAQRNFQASAKAIETSNTVTQTIIQI